MTKKLRWGLLSTARINDALIPGINQSPRSELSAVASRTFEKAKIYAAQRNIPHPYGSYQELIEDPNIDVIYNSLPNHLHAEWTIRAANAGKHVLCEKPMTLSHQDMMEIKSAAICNKVLIMEAIMYRSHPRTEKVLELIAQGMLGDILLLRGTYTNLLNKKDDYRWIPEFGGGALWDIGIYPVSYALMVAGSLPVSLYGSQVLTKSGVDITFAGQFTFNNGLMAQIECGFNAPYQSYFEIKGSKASLFVNFPFARTNTSSPILLRQDGGESSIPYENVEGYSAQVEKFNLAVLEGQPPALSLDESIQINQALLALLESARTNSIVSLRDRS